MRSVPVMEWNFNTSSDWDWENLSWYIGKASEIAKQRHISNHETEENMVEKGSIYSSGSGSFSGSALGHGSLYTSSVSASLDSSSRERTQKFGDIDDIPKDVCGTEEFSWMDKNGSLPDMVEASKVSAEPMVGLNLGTESNNKTTSFPTMPTSSSSQLKRSRASYQNMSPRCQVEGCSLDLISAKEYHRRHRICESHSKSPKVIVAGVERRFCQQCSRFHGLSEFDDKKRSCRRRLSDHNARRRRPQTDRIRFGSTSLSSSIYDRRSQMNFFVNRFQIPIPNPTWESGDFKITLAGESLFSLSKGGGVYKKSHSSGDLMPYSVSTLDLDSERDPVFQDLTPQVLNQGIRIPELESRVNSNSVVAPESRRAFSLLSTSSWALNEPESTALDHFGHENDISLAQPGLAQPGMPSELQNWGLLPSEYVRMEQTPSHHRSDKLDSQSIGINQIQDIHSLKSAHESPCFYSNQIN